MLDVITWHPELFCFSLMILLLLIFVFSIKRRHPSGWAANHHIPDDRSPRQSLDAENKSIRGGG
jgi:hypothetical protein